MRLIKFFFVVAIFSFSQISIAQFVNSSDGFCYAKALAPDKYDNVTERVLVKEAINRSVKVPAQYNTVTEQIEVIPASKKFVSVPAVYETITEEYIAQPESVRLINVPAVYESITEKILVKEESTLLTSMPAVFEMVTETIEVKPASKRFEHIAATYETVTERVETKSASIRYINVPAQYETFMEKVEIEPATTKIETIEPTYKVETEKVLTKPASTKWVETKGDKTCLSADPKDCIVWCMVEIPATYKTVTRRVNIGCDGSGIANSGCTKEIQVPAKYGEKAVKRLVTPATTREETIPAQYGTITKTVLKTPATTKEIEIPTEYITVSKQKVVTPAESKEEVVPAIYKDITKQRLVTPATTKEEVIPAVLKTRTFQKLVTPARTDEVEIPAVYETITKRVLVAPENVTIEEIPAEYQTISKRVLVNKGDLRWQRIVCPKHQTAQMNSELQEALRAKGYDVGPSDNIFGPRTYAAMVQFQKDNEMNSGHLDYETVAALGLETLPDDISFTESDAMMAAGPMAPTSPIAMTSKGGTAATNSSSGGASSTANDASNENNDNSDMEDEATTMSAEELEMVKEVNLMRANPKAYIPYVEAHLKNVENDPGLDAAYKAEELAAGRELIEEMKNLGPLPAIKPNEGLHKVAIGHGDYVRSVGQIGHKGADGSYPWDRVRKGTNMSDGNENLVAGGDSVRESLMILLVDSGIPGRGHRKTLFNPKWTHGGMYKIGKVGNIPNGWIQVFGSK